MIQRAHPGALAAASERGVALGKSRQARCQIKPLRQPVTRSGGRSWKDIGSGLSRHRAKS